MVSLRAGCPAASFVRGAVIGVDDATLVGAPECVAQAYIICCGTPRRSSSIPRAPDIAVHAAGAAACDAGGIGAGLERAVAAVLEVGDELLVNYHRLSNTLNEAQKKKRGESMNCDRRRASRERVHAEES